MIFFSIRTSGSGGNVFKGHNHISYLELWQHLRSFERNHLCNFGRRHHEEKLCEMVLDLNSGSDVV